MCRWKSTGRTPISGRKAKSPNSPWGYGGSVGALKSMGALEMGLAEEELQPLVDAWRTSNPNIVQLWWDVDNAVKTTVRQRLDTETHGIRFRYRSGMLFIILPSGRQLCYVKPKMGTNKFGGDSVTYEGVGSTKKWERIESYGPNSRKTSSRPSPETSSCMPYGRCLTALSSAMSTMS